MIDYNKLLEDARSYINKGNGSISDVIMDKLIQAVRELETAYGVRNDEVTGLIGQNAELREDNQFLSEAVDEAIKDTKYFEQLYNDMWDQFLAEQKERKQLERRIELLEKSRQNLKEKLEFQENELLKRDADYVRKQFEVNSLKATLEEHGLD